MFAIIRRFVPKPLLSLYHLTLALLATFLYRHPSDKMIVIGVTGTSGKSTVCYLLAKMFESAGYKVGCASTFLFKIDQREWLNDKKMTMVGRFQLQKVIAQMAKANCQYAIIETTSEGIKQFRHIGINYDIVVFTNLYPEHIESHGSFANYKKAKLKLFTHLSAQPVKVLAGQSIPKTVVVNLDDEHHQDFLAVMAEEKFGFTVKNQSTDKATVVRASDIQVSGQGIAFNVDNSPFKLRLLGSHNVSNALAAISVGVSQGLSFPTMAKGLEKISGIPGRIEFIDHGQPFTIIVDYAFEPKATEKLYQAIAPIKRQRIIHVLGSTGGGRDKARRPVLGKIAATHADYVIVTNEDPYDEDPQAIIDQVTAGALSAGKKLNQNLFTVLDRRQAIAQALSLAQKNDLVLVTGKGCEQAMVIKNQKKIPWDDRVVVKEELEKLRGRQMRTKSL